MYFVLLKSIKKGTGIKLNLYYLIANILHKRFSGCESSAQILTGGVLYQMRCIHLGQGCSMLLWEYYALMANEKIDKFTHES